MVVGWPAFWFFWLIEEKAKLESTIVVTGAEAPSGIVLSLWSWAKTVNEPPALSVTVKLRLPLASAASVGSVALPSVLRISITFVTEVTRFQLASHARTVIANG